ncbi:hypothetical protein AB0H12_18805 [Actinosynnema sp. NPDC023794]
MLLVGQWVARWGSRRVVPAMFVGYGVASPLLGPAREPWALFVGLAVQAGFRGGVRVVAVGGGVVRRSVISTEVR